MLKKEKKITSVLGIDFSNDEVRIIELDKVNGEYKILNYIVKEYPNNFKLYDSSDYEELIGFMKKISKQNNLKNKKIVSSVSGATVITKTFTIPKDASDREIYSLIKNSGKTHHEKGIESMAFDFYEIKNDEDENEKSILLKMSPIELITARDELVIYGGMKPVVVDIDDEAIARLMESFKEQYKKETADDIGENTIILIDIGNNKIVTRTLYNNTVLNTEEKLIRFEESDDKVEIFYKNIKSEVTKIKSLEETETHKIKSVFLMGKHENLKEIKRKMNQDKDFEEELHTIIANPFVNIKYTGNDISGLVEIAPSLVLACGLAMKDISKYE